MALRWMSCVAVEVVSLPSLHRSDRPMSIASLGFGSQHDVLATREVAERSVRVLHPGEKDWRG